jgi:NAD(P)H-dependent FMN reductase
LYPMPPFGNVPAQTLVDAVEKHVARMDDAALADVLYGGVPAMPQDARYALVASIFDAFRDRGESSEDAAEGANASLDRLEGADAQAVAALVEYARANPGLLKEALTHYAEEHATQLEGLPAPLVDGIAGTL